ncbi:transcriptional activator NhaR [Neiella marina]|uniref:Transcriptional activator NhaR n=1 Tax=Neiella marina TaxID=508461 RepID=A0A8J2U794_9GAMM|nr:transcriptional activator NhaR [Neiella marina]GGA83513.1 transcriptional activator NhaR [Neiella marina]
MINYKHLQYFWVAAKQGGIVRASEHLHLTPQTISGQITLLEEQLGTALFTKVGRKLELTETGRLVLSYADEIFSLGDELQDVLSRSSLQRPQQLKIGIADVVPKTIAHRLLQPALGLGEPIRIVCKENSLKELLAELALHRLDLVIADAPIPSDIGIRGFNHPLGDCGLSFMATPDLAAQLAGEFPVSLDEQPLLIPGQQSVMHTRLQQWLDQHHIRPNVVGEFDDSALMKAFGQAGAGVFAVPSAIAKEVAEQFNVVQIGATDDIREQFFAISIQRRISNPAVVAITQAAREWLQA